MAAFRIYRRLQDLLDVDPNGLPDQGVPQYETSVSSFVVQTIAGGGGGGGSFSLGASNLGNTLGQTGVTGSRVVLAGIGNLTLSQATDANGGTITISGGTVAAGAAFSAGVSGGNTAGDTGATGSRVVLAGGSNVTLSQATDANGASITVNAASQTEQTQHRFDLTASGNTAGALAAVSSGTFTLAGGNNVTLSQAGNAITISAANQSAQTGISSIAASDATYTSGQVQFTGSNIVTVRSSAGQRVVIDASQSVQTQARFNLTLSGNTSGALAEVSSGTLTLAGGNNITVSQAGNAITISGANAAGAQTGISGIANSQTTFTSGTVGLSELGAVTIRSTTGNQFQISVNSQSVQPETQTFVGGISASDTLYTSGTVRLTGVGGGITVSTNTGQRIDLSVAAQSVQPGVQHLVVSDTTFSSGTVSISGFGDVTVNTAANIIRVSAPVQTAESQSIGISNLGNTSGTTGIASGAQVRMLFAGGNRITLSQSLNGASGTITISAPNAQTGISGVANSQTTYTSGTVSLSELGAITIRSTTGNQYQFSVNSQTVQTQNLHNVTLSGNTAGVMAQISSGTMTLAGGNNITVSQNGNAVTISGPNVGGAQTGISGIIASDATFTSGTVEISGAGGGITVGSDAGQKVVLSVAAPVAQTGTQFSAGLSNIGNTAGDTGTVAGRLVMAGGNRITLSGSTNGVSQTVTISGAAAQTGISSIVASDATYTSGSVQFTGSGIVTVRSSANQRVVIDASQSVQTQSLFSAGVSNLGNTAGDTGVSGTRMVLAGLGAATLSQATNANGNTISISVPTQTAQTGISGIANSQTTYTSGTVSLGELGAITIRSTTGNQYQFSVNSQTVQTQNLHNVTLSGNTAGAMAHISSGTMTLAGGNNITLSQAGNAVTISGPATNPSFSAGLSNLGNTGGDTGVTGTRMVLVGSNNISLSQTTGAAGATVSFFGPSPSGGGGEAMESDIAQTAHGLSVGDWVRLDGTDYVLAQADSVANAEVVGVVSAVADANNFTLTTGGHVTGLSGLTAGAVYFLDDASAGAITATEPTTDGSVVKPVLIADTTTSGYVFNMRGNVINTAPATAFLAGLSNVGNTAGNTGITGSRLVLAGGNNITLSGSTNASGGTVTVSGPNTLPSFSGGVSNIGNSAGDTGVTGTRMVLAGGNNITLSQATNANGNTITISGGAGGGFSAGVSDAGNTAGDTGVTGTRLVLAGLGAATLSQATAAAGGTVSISVPTQTVQSVGLYAVGNTTGESSSTTRDARTISFRGDGAASVGYSNGSIRISVPTQTAQTGLSGLANSQTTYTSGTVSLSELGAITIRSTTGNQFQLSVAAQTAESQSIGMSNVGNTSGTTGMASGAQVRFVLAGGNNITLSQSLNGASGTITISAPNAVAQTDQTLGMYAVGNTTGQSSSTTFDARTVSLRGDGAVSVGYSNGTLRVSAPVQTAQTGISSIAGSDATYTSGSVQFTGSGIVTVRSSANQRIVIDASQSVQPGIQHIVASNTTFSSGTVSISGFGDVTVNTAANIIRISAPVQTVESQSIGMSNLGNTSGTTGMASGAQVRFALVGGDNITLSQSLNGASGTITISAGAGGTGAFAAGVSTGGNTAGDTGVTGTRLVLVAPDPMSLSQTTGAAGATVSIQGPATSSLSATGMVSISTNGSTISIGVPGSTKSGWPELARMQELVVGQQGNGTLHVQPLVIDWPVQFDRAVFPIHFTAATNSTNTVTLSQWVGLYTKTGSTLSMRSSFSGSVTWNHSGTQNSSVNVGGIKLFSVGMTDTLSPSEYWIGLVSRTSTSSHNATVSQFLISQPNSNFSGFIGAVSTASQQVLPGLGTYSATTSGIPASIAFSQLTGTGSIVLRPPAFQLLSGTV